MIIHYDNILLLGLICFAAMITVTQREALHSLLATRPDPVFGQWQNPEQTPGLLSLAMLCITAVAIVRLLSNRK